MAEPQKSDKEKRQKRPRPRAPQLDFNKNMKIEVCHHIYCMSDGAKYTYKRLQNDLKLPADSAAEGATTPDGKITIDKCQCLGHCKKGPNLKVTYTDEDKEEVYERVNTFKVGEMIRRRPNS